MNTKTYLLVSGVIFGLIALVHVLRLAAGLPFVVGSYSAPVGVSIVGVIVFAFLSYSAFRLRPTA